VQLCPLIKLNLRVLELLKSINVRV